MATFSTEIFLSHATLIKMFIQLLKMNLYFFSGVLLKGFLSVSDESLPTSLDILSLNKKTQVYTF